MLFVMSEEQVEILGYQIAAYSTICEQLLDLHKNSLSSHHHDLAGIRSGNLYLNPSASSFRYKQRWKPKPVQLQALDQIYEHGNGATPDKKKIREIALDLSQYGKISEVNVYNWFQNKRARVKRKQSESRVERINNSEDSPQVTTSEVSSNWQPVEPHPECGWSQMSFYQSMNQMMGNTYQT